MKFDETDPTTWTAPHFHPDWQIDSAKQVDMLRACCIAIIASKPNIIARLIVDTEEGILYCKIVSDAATLGELYCCESLKRDLIRLGFFSEISDSTRDFELYADTATDMCRIVSSIHEGKDLKALHEEFGEFQ